MAVEANVLTVKRFTRLDLLTAECLIGGVAIELPVAKSLDADPQPTGTRMYCSPLTVNVTGTE
jgi:hypothetical protein